MGQKLPFQNDWSRGWSSDSMVKYIVCCSRGLGLNLQHPHGRSQLSQECYTYTHAPIHVKFKKKLKMIVTSFDNIYPARSWFCSCTSHLLNYHLRSHFSSYSRWLFPTNQSQISWLLLWSSATWDPNPFYLATWPVLQTTGLRASFTFFSAFLHLCLTPTNGYHFQAQLNCPTAKICTILSMPFHSLPPSSVDSSGHFLASLTLS